jgi:hypothetical protein
MSCSRLYLIALIAALILILYHGLAFPFVKRLDKGEKRPFLL